MFCLSRSFVGVDVERAVETAPKREKCWSMGVKTFIAAGTANQTGKGDNDDEENNPGYKDKSYPRLIIGGIKGNHHCRKIGTYDKPQRQSSFPNFFQAFSIFAGIWLGVFCHSLIFLSIWLVVRLRYY